MIYENVNAQIHPKSAAQRQRTLPYGHQCSLCIIWNIIFYYKLERKCIANACQFVIIYYKLGRSCSANAFQFVIIYYKLGRSCSANAFQFVIIYYKLGRNCITYAFQFVIIYYKLERYYKLGRNMPLFWVTLWLIGYDIKHGTPAGAIRWINVGLALAQRRRRWSNVKPILI